MPHPVAYSYFSKAMTNPGIHNHLHALVYVYVPKNTLKTWGASTNLAMQRKAEIATL